MASLLRFTWLFPLGFSIATTGLARADDPPSKVTDGSRPVQAKAKAQSDQLRRDVRSILSENCFACHGPDDKQRKAGLRLDIKQGALGKLKSGGAAVVPGKADESELIFRIETDDAEARCRRRNLASS